MISTDVKSLLKLLDPLCVRAMEAAAGYCINRGHYEISVEHVLLKLIEDQTGDIPKILQHFRIDPGRFEQALLASLEKFKTGNTGRPTFSPILLELLERSWLQGSIELGHREIRSGVLLLVLADDPEFRTLERYADLLDGIATGELKRDFMYIVADSSEDRPAFDYERPAVGPAGERMPEGETALDRFTIDFTGQARAGKIDPVFGRDDEIRQMVDILMRRRKNNPILVGEPGTGKTAIVEGLALRVVSGDVPSVLAGVDIRGLDLGLLQAGAGVKGEFENRLKAVIDEIRSYPKSLVTFIDEAHTLIGAGGSAGQGDAANLLKPALARGELRTVAATTWSEYKKYFEKDPALARRFQLVKIEEPSVEKAVSMMRGLKEKYEQSHNIRILDSAVTAAVELSDRFISGRFLPDKAVDLIDTAAARVRVAQSSKPHTMEMKERRIIDLDIEIAAKQRDMEDDESSDEEETLSELLDERDRLKAEVAELEAKWQQELAALGRVLELRAKLRGEAGDEGSEAGEEEAESPETTGEAPSAKEAAEAVPQAPEDPQALRDQLREALKEFQKAQGDSPMINLEVSEDVVAQVVADWTGVPVGKMVGDAAQNVLSLADRLGERILGQAHALETVVKGIQASKAGVGNPNTPIGVFFFVGPSGVGKTECALGVADILFGGERFVATINMSEYMEKHTVSRLIGSPPGYVGYGEGGVLTEAVRQRPYSVVLLDEVEKANPEVMNLFYQVFDKGMLSDGEGREIDFKNTVVMMTSNLGSEVIMDMFAEGKRPEPDQVVETLRPVLQRHLKPALLARMIVVPFYPIDPETMRAIVRLKLDKVVKRMRENNQMQMTYTDAVVDAIADRCTDVESGARDVDHMLQAGLLPMISTQILAKMSEDAMPAALAVDVDSSGEFVLKFS